MQQRKIIIYVLLLVIVAFAFQGTRSIWIQDEQRYTNIAVEGILAHDWLLPALQHEHYHFEKPPLTYWAIRCSVQAFGWNQWAARVPNALAFIFMVLLCFGLVKRLSPGTGLIAPLILTASPLAFIGMSIINTDTLLSLFETVAVYGFVGYRWRPERPLSRLLFMWLGFGLAFLTKGPPALLPLAAISAFVLVESGWRGLARLFDWRGLVIFAVLGCSWYFYVIYKFPYLLHAFVSNEVVGRIFTAQQHHNPGWKGLLLIYVPTMVLATFPWVLLMLVRRPGGVAMMMPRRSCVRQEPELAFLWIWLLLPLLVFLASQSRLPFYLEPLAVPFSLLAARYLHRYWSLVLVQRIVAAQLAVLLFAKLIFGLYSPPNDPRRFARSINAAVGDRPLNELVFVEGPRIQGLSLYTKAEVEVVAIKHSIPPSPGELNHHTTQSLEQEIAEHEPHIVYLVPANHVKRFTAEVRRLGYAATRFGSYKGFGFYRLSAESAGRRG